MTEEMKKQSDLKSLEIFGMDNAAHNEVIMKEWSTNNFS